MGGGGVAATFFQTPQHQHSTTYPFLDPFFIGFEMCVVAGCGTSEFQFLLTERRLEHWWGGRKRATDSTMSRGRSPKGMAKVEGTPSDGFSSLVG